jgi:glutamyl-tRNA reductase
MASLSVATAARFGAAEISVLNRTPGKSERLASEYGAASYPLSSLAERLAGSDVVVSCTGATSVLVSRELMEQARIGAQGPLAVIDLALPHDVDPDVVDLPGVTLVGLAALAEKLRYAETAADVVDVRAIVAQELAGFLAVRRQASVTPTVVALRSMATSLVNAEMQRLSNRLPGLDEATRSEVLHTVRRVAEKLLHEPTVRLKDLAGEESAVSYTAAIAELFRLNPEAVS